MNDILGIHYLLDFYDCNNDYLVSVSKIKKVMIEAGKIGNFNVVKSLFHQFKPYGISIKRISFYNSYMARISICSYRYILM